MLPHKQFLIYVVGNTGDEDEVRVAVVAALAAALTSYRGARR